MADLSFQQRVGVWVQQAFGTVLRYNQKQRSQRFLEEALELAQANDLSKQDALDLVDYTYGRPVGVAAQEVGGVMITLAALCDASEINMVQEGEKELTRINDPAIMAKIQAKQATKPANSSLPGRTPVEASEKFKIEAFNPVTKETKLTLAKPPSGVHREIFGVEATEIHLFDTSLAAQEELVKISKGASNNLELFGLHFRVVAV